MPRFSIVVPMYNVERYVEECLASLRRQSFRDFEVICVDDGSTDTTLAQARRAAAGDGRFVFVERPNGGLSAARNTGLDVAAGEYVCFLDSDDRYVPGALEAMDRAICAGDLDLLDYSASTFYESDEVRELHEESYDYRDAIAGVHTGPELFVLYWDKTQFIASACFHAIRRDVLDAAGLRFGEGLLCEDELFTPLMYAAVKRAAYLDEQLYERRVRADSIMTAPVPSISRVKSLAAIAQLLHAWLLDHAEEHSDAFIDAFARDISYIRDAAYRATAQVDADELAGYLAGLSPDARVEFDLCARYASLPAETRREELADSRDYRVGRVALMAPRAIKRALLRMKR